MMQMTRGESHVSRTPAPLPCPWLVFSHPKTQTFFSLPEGCHYVKKIPDMCDTDIWACFHGWMVISADNSANVFLLNPVSMEKIKLPPLKHKRYNFCVLSSPPNDPNCIIAFFIMESPHITFCRPGDNEWVEQEVESEDEWLDDATACQGKIYGLTKKKSLVALEVEGKQTLAVKQLVSETSPSSSLPEIIRAASYLIESCGEIFFLVKSVIGEAKVRDIDVYKMDFSKLAWVEVESLGDRAFFVNDQSNCISCSAVESGIKGNSIYFVELNDKGMYVFDVEEKSIFVTIPCPNVAHNCSLPQWIMPVA